MFKSLHSKIIGSIIIAGTLLIVFVYTILYFVNIQKSQHFNEKKLDMFVKVLKSEQDSNNFNSLLESFSKEDPFIQKIVILDKGNIITFIGRDKEDKVLFSKDYLLKNKQVKIDYGYSAVEEYVSSLKFRMAIVALSFYLLVFIISIQIGKLLDPFNDIVRFFEQFSINKLNLLQYSQQKVSSEFTYVKDSINSMSNKLFKFKEKLTHTAYFDKLTGLPNRAAYIKDIEERKVPYSILFLDLDGFKLINDTFGHETGDQVLSIIGSRLLMSLENMSVFRLGGDEFIVILESTNSLEIINTTKDIHEILGKDMYLNNQIVNISTSIGISIVNDKNKDSLKEADIAMYEAKKEGKNRYKFFSPIMEDKIKDQLKLIRDIKIAAQNEDFFFVIQPQVEISTGDIIGGEALIRWNCHGKILSPYYFIDILENSKYIIPVGYQIIKNVFIFTNQLTKFKGRISINLAEKQLEEKSFVLNIIRIMKETEVDPSLIEFEITERWNSIDSNVVLSNIKALKKLGFSLSIDDFGEDNSSFKRTDILPIDKLKLDKSFVDRMFEENTSLHSIKTIYTYSELSGFDMIVEGVETLEQKNKLEEMGIKYVQGYFFYKPISSEEFKKLIL